MPGSVFVAVRFLKYLVLYLHQARYVASFVFIKLHYYAFDSYFEVGDHNMFKSVDATSCFFYLRSKELNAFFSFCKLDELR